MAKPYTSLTPSNLALKSSERTAAFLVVGESNMARLTLLNGGCGLELKDGVRIEYRAGGFDLS